MKKVCLFALAVGMLGLVAAPAAFAGKGGKGKKGGAAQATVRSDIYVTYDKNYNAALDADEKAALLKDFEADKTGPLKVWDTDADGKLSDGEITAIPPTKPAEAPAKKGKKGKKNK